MVRKESNKQNMSACASLKLLKLIGGKAIKMWGLPSIYFFFTTSLLTVQ